MSEFYAPTQQATLTAEAIITNASLDMRRVIDYSVAADQTQLLDWLNRAQLILLRASKWRFLLKGPYYFITAREQTDYWLGQVDTAPNGVVDTQLNLTDLDTIQRNSVRDVTNSRSLLKTDVLPFSRNISKNDGLFRPGRPAEWRQDLFVPQVLNIYPAPDNQNSWQPVPQTPFVTFVAGGALATRTYLIVTSFVDSLGYEGSTCNREAVVTIPAGFLAVVNSPKLPLNLTTYGVSYNQYKVYAVEIANPAAASTNAGAEILQTVTPISYGLNWTEATTGLLTTGPGIPSTSNVQITPMDGYVIEFRYYAQRQLVLALADILQIPDVYKDILIAGVCWYASQYLKQREETAHWQQLFMDGVRQMVRDANLIPAESDYLHPDDVSLGIGYGTGYSAYTVNFRS